MFNAGLPVVLCDGSYYLYGFGLEAMEQSGDWYYFLADGLGSTMAIVDDAGAVQNSYTYDVYGEAAVTGSLANEFDFAGQQTDGDTGLQYLRARYMDPETGVFFSRDPLAVMPSWLGSHFGYASGNPATATDPTGLCDDGSPTCEGADGTIGYQGEAGILPTGLPWCPGGWCYRGSASDRVHRGSLAEWFEYQWTDSDVRYRRCWLTNEYKRCETTNRSLIDDLVLLFAAASTNVTLEALKPILQSDALFRRWLQRPHPIDRPLDDAARNAVLKRLDRLGIKYRCDSSGVKGYGRTNLI